VSLAQQAPAPHEQDVAFAPDAVIADVVAIAQTLDPTSAAMAAVLRCPSAPKPV
jgi:hypothetical protein